MRGIEALILATFVGLGLWNAQEWLPRGISVLAKAPSVAPAYVPAEPSKAAEQLKPRTVKRAHARADQLDAGAGLADDPANVTEVVVPLRVGPPDRNGFRLGSTSDQIRAKYGEPDLRVTEVCGGHICEHYYYYNHDRTQFSVATLQSGVLVSSDSTSR